MDRCTGHADIIEIMLKTAFYTNQSMNPTADNRFDGDNISVCVWGSSEWAWKKLLRSTSEGNSRKA